MDAMFCHKIAMNLMRKLNGGEQTITPQMALVAAATVAPEDEIAGDAEEDGAPAFAASCVVLLCAYISTLLS